MSGWEQIPDQQVIEEVKKVLEKPNITSLAVVVTFDDDTVDRGMICPKHLEKTLASFLYQMADMVNDGLPQNAPQNDAAEGLDNPDQG